MDQKLYQCFDAFFSKWIDDNYTCEKIDNLHKACIYALKGEGKRIRPLFLLESFRVFSHRIEDAYIPAVSIEMIHTYSLVHDDLPSMDNDDVRRGRPTVHKAFDEATAILVGDALLTDAFSVFSRSSLDSTKIVALIKELSNSSGSLGMVQGQSLDICCDNYSDNKQEILFEIHLRKTAKLFAAALAMGGIAAGANNSDIDILRKVGELVGMSFQMMDDLIDDDQNIGKTSGKDKAQNKLTYITIMSKNQVEIEIRRFVDQATELLQNIKNSEKLQKMILSLLNRKK